MGTELTRFGIAEGKDKIPPVPPGFESITSFCLRGVEDGDGDSQNSDRIASYSRSSDAFDSQMVQMANDTDFSDHKNLTRFLRRRPWINYGQANNNCKDFSARRCLPKGVIHGCSECDHWQKITARWHPEASCRPDLEDAPAFYPTEEEFEDPLKYITVIRPVAEKYGICRIVPPACWKPPCPLKEKNIWDSFKFTTRIQKINKLQNRKPMDKMSEGNDRRKKRRLIRTGINCGAGSFELHEPEMFGFEPGPEFTPDKFQKYADEFKAQYFGVNVEIRTDRGELATLPKGLEPSVQDIEGEYWRIVEKPTEEIEVLYGADLETGEYGSGFPRASSQTEPSSDDRYIKSGWNLNNLPRLPGSVLAYEESDISGVLVPWLYIGMCFSSFCWHVEDHHMYSLSYMHWGAPKMWYGVPGRDAAKLEEAMRKHLPDLFEEQPDLLHKLVTRLSPSILTSEGVPVYRCVQNPGEFVLTFPRAYHSGFNCGFNCAEAVNVAPVDWLPHGQIAIELYREQGRRTSISHDKLLLGAAREAVKACWEVDFWKNKAPNDLRWKDVCGKDGVLTRALKARVEMERVRRDFLCKSSRTIKMDSSFDTSTERECIVCQFDLHLSAAGCRCSPEIYACLNHAKQLCSCSSNAKYFLFRYDISELNILVEALEGKLSSIYRWARQDLGLSLSAHASRGSLQVAGPGGKLPPYPQGPMSKRLNSKTSANSPEGSHFENQVFVTSDSQLSMNNASSTEEFGSGVSAPKMSLFTELVNVTVLSDDEDDDRKNPHSGGEKRTSENHIEISERAGSANTSLASLAGGKSNSSVIPLRHANKEHYEKYEASPDLNPSNVHCLAKSGASIQRVSTAGESIDGCMEQTRNDLQHPQLCVSGKYKIENNDEKAVMDASLESARNKKGNSSFAGKNIERFTQQKRPRIAKIVRRFICNAEPLDHGVVVSGKLWCTGQAIFPKGFKSRVKYISILDPTNMCNYLSEIHDMGRGPLFVVSLEDCPNEVFIHVTPTKCWEMVRERINQEITRQHQLGRPNLPPLQPPGSLDGFEMFGFSSPAIVQAIEAMDQNRVCTEYWESRLLSGNPAEIPQSLRPKDSDGNLKNISSEQNNKLTPTDHDFPVEVDRTLKGLIKKANGEELHMLYSLLRDSSPTTGRRLLACFVQEELRLLP